LRTEAEAVELGLLSEDEARLRRVPTPRATPGVKRHRPTAGTRDGRDPLYVLVVVTAVHADLL
jgi:hypothetical protein